ncbi:hypothetical protein LUZ63_008012 [Rhynchospora breviuscula]|uniref:Uncharacterized protein n=1 Tax=Rhynchospora breviuscula TaxID=2022672 RepID=A0A9Q0CTB9_9POAL|nr:hypothetical protein LUZ63_008012 [Rhynchospora breviuscula]
MAPVKSSIGFLLIISGCLMLGLIQNGEAQVMCPQFCVSASYMMCKATGHEHVAPACNCCLVQGQGCTIYLSDGSKMRCD